MPQGGIMGLAGDTGAQTIEALKKGVSVTKSWSHQRSGIIFLWSWTTQGVPMYEWFRFLDGKWPTPQGVKGWVFWRPVLVKQILHQAVTCPILNIGFISFLSVWQRERPSQPWAEATERRLRQDLLPLKASTLGYCWVHPQP